MSGPATPEAIKHLPCSRCGSRRAIRWMRDGVVACVDLDACAKRQHKRETLTQEEGR